MGSGGPRSALDYVLTQVPNWAPWMGKNLLLAAIPVALALFLFRGGRRRTPLWWTAFVTFVVFLPNTPYVLADYRWLRGPWLNAWYQDRWRFLFVLPIWALYFGLGFIGFVLAVRLAQRNLAAQWSWPWSRVAVTAMCLLSAIGIYLGRADLNSWSLVTEPQRVADVLTDQPSLGAILRIAFAFVVLLAGYAVLVTAYDRARHRHAHAEAGVDPADSRRSGLAVASAAGPAAPLPGQ